MKKKRGINLCIGWSPTSKTGKTVYVLAGCLKGRVLFSYSATEELCFRIWVLILDFSYPGTDRRSYERRSQEGRGEKETFFFLNFLLFFSAPEASGVVFVTGRRKRRNFVTVSRMVGHAESGTAVPNALYTIVVLLSLLL